MYHKIVKSVKRIGKIFQCRIFRTLQILNFVNTNLPVLKIEALRFSLLNGSVVISQQLHKIEFKKFRTLLNLAHPSHCHKNKWDTVFNITKRLCVL